MVHARKINPSRPGVTHKAHQFARALDRAPKTLPPDCPDTFAYSPAAPPLPAGESSDAQKVELKLGDLRRVLRGEG